jgi:pyruvate/2-oxoacid:ferredoxin oxidoreductase alpha subunit
MVQAAPTGKAAILAQSLQGLSSLFESLAVTGSQRLPTTLALANDLSHSLPFDG